MKKLVLHIPHSSTTIPKVEGYIVSQSILNSEILKLTDWYTDDLFQNNIDKDVLAPFSRIFCDVERFSEDEKEVMSKFGMGALYTTLDNGEEMREVTTELRKLILDEYYWIHHNKLEKAVDDCLTDQNKCLIVDCHSFPNIPLERTLDKKPNRPDINIGTDSFHTPKHIVDISEKFFLDKGYSVGIDWPYTGSMVPTKHYKKDKRVSSILIEINRRLYLEEGSNNKSNGYSQIKLAIQEYLELLRSIC
jgi:N-formylglutamate amidohydrolase